MERKQRNLLIMRMQLRVQLVKKWNSCQTQKLRNARHYERTATYLFTNKLRCSKCGNFLGGSATTKKKSGKKYYYYKCEHCKTNFKEKDIEQYLISTLFTITKFDELINDYYTPFIKSKLNNKQIDYEKEIKDYDKQLDRIKTAYIKGVVKLDDFDKEIKHIEYQKEVLTKKYQEQKQYENLNFTIDNLLILQDKQDMDFYINPKSFYDNVLKIMNNDRESKQRLLVTYIDNIEVAKVKNELIINKINFRESFLKDLIDYHEVYGLPFDIKIFEDDYGFKISMNKEIISKEQAHKYFDKLEDTLGNGYKLHYYEVQTDEDFNGKITFKPKSEVEKNNQNNGVRIY